MEVMLIVLFAFVGLLGVMIIGVCIAYFYSKAKKGTSARSPHTTANNVLTEEPSGPGPGPASAPPTGSLHKSGSKTYSCENTDFAPAPKSNCFQPYKADKSLVRSTSMTKSQPEKGDRLRMKDFKFAGFHKKFTRLPEGPLAHAFSRYPRNHALVPKILTQEIKGDIKMYPPDFVLNLPLIAAARRKAEILEHYYHLGQPVMDNAEYKRRRMDAQALPEPVPVEGNHEKVRHVVEGVPFLEMKPHLAKMPAKRDDTIRHFILNTQYAARLAVRFVSPTGRYISIPSHEIVEPSGRLRVVIVANSDMDDQPEKEVVYYEYIQVPERAMDAAHEFTKRPVIGRLSLRLFPNMLNLSPNTFYPSARRRTIVYASTLTNSGKSPCKFAWNDERDVMVSPQNGFIKPQSSVKFSFTLKRPVTTNAIVAAMSYTLADKPNAAGTMTVRFETGDMKRLIQVSTKALAACDTAEDPGHFN